MISFTMSTSFISLLLSRQHQYVKRKKFPTYSEHSYKTQKDKKNKLLTKGMHEREKSRSLALLSSLSQLRSGYSRMLNTYLHKIEERNDDCCSLCNQSPYNTVHLFSCPNNPTKMDVFITLDPTNSGGQLFIPWGRHHLNRYR